MNIKKTFKSAGFFIKSLPVLRGVEEREALIPEAVRKFKFSAKIFLASTSILVGAVVFLPSVPVLGGVAAIATFVSGIKTLLDAIPLDYTKFAYEKASHLVVYHKGRRLEGDKYTMNRLFEAKAEIADLTKNFNDTKGLPADIQSQVDSAKETMRAEAQKLTVTDRFGNPSTAKL